MPYITKKQQDELEAWKYGDTHREPATPGELNYLITVLLRDYFKAHSNYQGINDIMGALSSAQAEFYRRIAVPYEENKCYDNGDVYDVR